MDKLFCECRSGSLQSVEKCLQECLQEFGAHEKRSIINVEQNGYTPLLVACERGDVNIVKFLILNDAEVNAKSKDGLTSLHIASQSGKKEIAEVLLENGALTTIQDTWGCTPWFWATSCGYSDIVCLLAVKCTAGIDIRSKNGFSPLHIASYTGNFEIAQILVNCGADIYLTSKNEHKTALDIALSSNKPKLAKFLKSLQPIDVEPSDSSNCEGYTEVDEGVRSELWTTRNNEAAQQADENVDSSSTEGIGLSKTMQEEEFLRQTNLLVVESPSVGVKIDDEIAERTVLDSTVSDLIEKLFKPTVETIMKNYQDILLDRIEVLEENFSTRISSIERSVKHELKTMNLSLQDQYSALGAMDQMLKLEQYKMQADNEKKDVSAAKLFDGMEKLLRKELLPSIKVYLETVFTQVPLTNEEEGLSNKLDLLLKTITTMKTDISKQLEKIHKDLSCFYKDLEKSMKSTYEELAKQNNAITFTEVKRALENHLLELTNCGSHGVLKLDALTNTLKDITNGLHEDFLSSISLVLRCTDNQNHALEKIIRKMEQIDQAIADRLNKLSDQLDAVNSSVDEKLKTLEFVKVLMEEQKQAVLAGSVFDEEKIVSEIKKSFRADLTDVIISAFSPILQDNAANQSSELQRVINMIETLQEGLYARIVSLSVETKENFDKLHSCLRHESWKCLCDGQSAILTTLSAFVEAQARTAQEENLTTLELQSSFNQFMLSSKQHHNLVEEQTKTLKNMYSMIENIVVANEKDESNNVLNQAEKLRLILSNIESMQVQVSELHQFNKQQMVALAELHGKTNVLPHLFCVLPSNVAETKLPEDSSMKQTLQQGLRMVKSIFMKPFWESSRLFFICPVLLKPAHSGQDGKGYEIKIPTKLCRNVICALKFGLVILNIVLASQSAMIGNIIGPLRNLFPWLDLDTVDDLIKQLPVDQMQQGIEEVVENNDESNSVMRSVFKFVAEAENVKDLNLFQPAYSGLVLIKSDTGISGWVCDEEEAKHRFKTLGREAYHSIHN